MPPKSELPLVLRTSWREFLETYEPLRPDLYRYCRHLSRTPWDAEDLAQDTLTRAFVTLAQMGHSPANPRAWLFRVASNLWIDRARRVRREDPLVDEGPAAAPLDPRAAREAAGTLLGQLSPQERAAVVLKDVFDFSLEETASALATTTGAIKAALHRARGKLVEPLTVSEATPPAPAVIDAFCAAFNAGDLDRLTALLLDSASVEVVGATVLVADGGEDPRRTVLTGMLFGVTYMASGKAPIAGLLLAGLVDRPPRIEARFHRGAWLLLHWYTHEEGDAVRAMTRLDLDGGGIARLRNHFYSPELVAEVCAELGLPHRSNGRRWWR